MNTVEDNRLEEAQKGTEPWRFWGPYLSERQWGTVREDYSEDGNAWDYFSHDQARSRAYRWGEDGLGGISDEKQRLCFALCLWNGQDPILKERLFGMTNAEGNHGEDVKEYYFYLDSSPTHSYMKYLYKYPQRAYPYDDIVAGNRKRNKFQQEYELVDTGVFNESRYFDVFVEYAKASPHDCLIEIRAVNRGPDAAPLHILPTLWFRNTWSWGSDVGRPILRFVNGSIEAEHEELGRYVLEFEGEPTVLFTENETNLKRIMGGANATPFVKDSFHRLLIHSETDAVNPSGLGTKAAPHYFQEVPAGGEARIRLRLSRQASGFADFDRLVESRRKDTDDFFDSITPPNTTDDEKLVMRQALAGMMWTKQYYYYDVEQWMKERGADPILGHGHLAPRNSHWFHMVNADIISMPDKWEYPWYAAWDLAFHTIPLAMMDLDFAKDQLTLMLKENYLHPNGQIPAYEWKFEDVNPPVHAWAVNFMMVIEKQQRGKIDYEFVEHAFQKLLMNFTWWVNRKDTSGNNVFEGGFLGLDNIGVFDRSQGIPGGGALEQADGTSWMAFFSAMMMQLAIELAQEKPVYEAMACKFYEHFVWIAAAMDRVGDHHDEIWDEKDGFFYDVLRFPNGNGERLKVRSMVGLLALAATSVIPREKLKNLPRFVERTRWFNRERQALLANISNPSDPGPLGTHLLSLLNESKLRKILARLLDPNEFLSDYGIRALSRYHLDNPYNLVFGRNVYRVQYEPAESTTRMFGGNSNWRGPIWFPVNLLLIRALVLLHTHFGSEFQVECPTGSGQMMNLGQVALEVSCRLNRIFLRNDKGRRPVYGDTELLQTDPHWRDLILFYEYFHGDNGAGIGASHQTGWTGIVARLIQFCNLHSDSDMTTDSLPKAIAFRTTE
jgi:hypothetical protein